MNEKKIFTCIGQIIREKKWLDRVDDISFLAAGEYNENYLVTAHGQKYVFRINRGTQLNRSDQIRYEYDVLRAVQASFVTPTPRYVASHSALGGVLLMDFIPGRSFLFDKDLNKVPPVFAAIHQLPISDKMVCQKDPMGDIARESYQLLHRFSDHPLVKEKNMLLAYHEKILKLRQDHRSLFAREPLCIVNTEVNSGNFIIQDNKGFLVDWEKAVVSCRYQDLAHFIIPTTTLWKSDFKFTSQGRIEFLQQYHRLIAPEFSFDELAFKTAILEKTILLRALSWCFMAYAEYTGEERVLKDKTTFNKINTYLGNMECFLK
ncbi:Phosphotransferase enzyme family protein [Desulfocicer vacuolatum DSM 3385]|uniref:Phosphotransferase enzyme family protein n=1 Tax=Desulfocicer vacuolatum DSM 3385 TaxID=1121400 RepID=A0A1W2B665_9BACT|nr:phosphotransferase [Desulfocicer vacuolatum]SMC68477.1 Phosphotransferase enzyme family protein [Desulfocicer vacuolatum DSM 3385]